MKSNVPDCVGVPDSVPPEDSVSPGGNVSVPTGDHDQTSGSEVSVTVNVTGT